MGWLSLAKLLLTFANHILGFLRDGKLTGLGRDQAVKEGLESLLKEMDRAQAVARALADDVDPEWADGLRRRFDRADAARRVL